MQCYQQGAMKQGAMKEVRANMGELKSMADKGATAATAKIAEVKSGIENKVIDNIPKVGTITEKAIS